MCVLLLSSSRPCQCYNPGWGHSRTECWSVKLVQVLGRKFRACKPCSRYSSGIFPFQDAVYTPNPAPDTGLSLRPQPKGRGTYRFWCGSLRRRHPCSFMSASSEPLGGFRPNLNRHTIGTGKQVIRFWWPWPHFQGQISTLNIKFLPKAAYLHPISWIK